MKNLNLFNAMMGKALTETNSDEEVAEEIDELMNMSLGEFPAYFAKIVAELPAGLRKIKISTLFDLVVNLADEETIAELEKLCEE